jgi:SEL1 protein
MKGRAVKVIDLLEHSAELGNTDALYALAKLSLVSGYCSNSYLRLTVFSQLPPNHYFPANPVRAYEAFSAHAAATGNASAHAHLAFFHATGYHSVVPADQAKAQLYYTFAAHGGDRGAQTALGYRAWAGIGTVRDCARAAHWYESAAEQGAWYTMLCCKFALSLLP